MSPRSARLPLMEFEVSAELVGIYLEDAREHLAVLDATLLRLEREGHDPEVAASLLGPLHTLKGNSGMMGFTGVKDYVHRLEEVFARARDGALVLDPLALDRLLEGATALRAAVESACAAGSEARDLSPEKAALGALLDAAGGAARSRGGRGHAGAREAGARRRRRPPSPPPARAWCGWTSRSSTTC